MRVLGIGLSHDASAVLLDHDRIVVAIEEERLTRMKHWNYAPLNAIRHCLKVGRAASRPDVVAVASNETALNRRLRSRTRQRGLAPELRHFSAYLGGLLDEYADARPARFRFHNHHLAHAFSAYATAGCRDSLVVTLDGSGDGLAGLAITIRDGAMEVVARVTPPNSLGLLYEAVTAHLGYGLFDEYKVMGLAPYGNPEIYRAAFLEGIELGAGGRFTIDRPAIVAALGRRIPPRAPGAPFESRHCDLAASLQEAAERTAFHFLAHLRRHTGQRNLCYAGGFAHNCSFNGKLAYSGLFERIFVAPAADDSGLALGAACLTSLEEEGWAPQRRPCVFLGRRLRGGDLSRWLGAWKCLSWSRATGGPRQAARLLADGQVLGWVQGRSEFGPRALGNRSILAHPGPAANKGRINAMIKKREAFRPFAPAVALEAAAEFFELPTGQREFPTMSAALRVRPDKRDLLGAVTHVDGTARVQTVRRRDNPRFWSLLTEFGALTGLPVLLNTSFNNHREPIVDTPHDAVTCFLTTELDDLVIGDFVIRKTGAHRSAEWLGSMFVRLRESVTVRGPRGERSSHSRHHALRPQPVSEDTCALLARADGRRPLGELALAARLELGEAVVEEVFNLWSERHLLLSPTRITADVLWPSEFDRQWA